MATIKSHTDIGQSRLLAKFLPIESADMCYIGENNALTVDYLSAKKEFDATKEVDIFPCWSLAALLSILHDYTLQTNTDGTVFVVCESKKPMISDAYDNPVDACVAMIEKLHKLKLL